ncbi:MAG TPA: ZIP family metal transporter [Candidatus Acidoferrales bacterium]|nr:ZIP family metal transporter [Candidatus Acidoferrales bacterium]
MKSPETTRILVALLLGLTAAGANVLGGLFVARRQWSHRFLKYFIALGAGFMLATALLEMIPESVKLGMRESWVLLFPNHSYYFGGSTTAVFVLVLAGYFLVHFFEHTVAPHFHFGEETHHEEVSHAHASYAALLGLVIHTFFDGVAIASGLLVSTWLGGVIFMAVFLHKIPEGFTVSSLMLASGQSRAASFASSAILGAATLAGMALMFALRSAVADALPFSAGVTLYVAASDLIPEVNREPHAGMAGLVFLGVAILLALKAIFKM